MAANPGIVATPIAWKRSRAGNGADRNGSPCPLLQHVPEIEPVPNDEGENLRREGVRDTFMEVVEHLFNDQDLLGDVATFMNRREKRKREMALMIDKFDVEITSFLDIDENTLACWLMEIEPRVTVALLQAAVLHDEKFVFHALEILSGIPGTMRIVPDLRVVSACKDFYFYRIRLAGHLNRFVAALAAQPIDLKSCGPYAFEKNDDAQIVRVSYFGALDVGIPDGLTLTTAWKLENYYSCLKAQLSLGRTHLVIATLFENDAGPNLTMKTAKQLQTAVNEWKATLAAPAAVGGAAGGGGGGPPGAGGAAAVAKAGGAAPPNPPAPVFVNPATVAAAKARCPALGVDTDTESQQAKFTKMETELETVCYDARVLQPA